MAGSLVGERSDRAIVLDTNFVGKGNFRPLPVRALARRLGARGHDLLIPQVVVWEWASHAHETLVAAEASLSTASARVDPSLADVPSIEVPSVDELVSSIEAEVRSIENVGLLEADDALAHLAIRQQATQTGVGTRLKGTTTGAADALILGQLEQLTAWWEEVVLASNDKLLGAAADSIGVRVVRTQRDLWAWVGLTPPPANQLATTLQAFILEEAEAAKGAGTGFPLLVAGAQIDREVMEHASFHVDDVRQTDVSVEYLDSVWLNDLEVVVGDEVPRVVICTAYAAAIVDLTNWYVGGLEGELLDEWSTENVVIEASITVDLDESWKPLALEIEDSADVWLADGEDW